MEMIRIKPLNESSKKIFKTIKEAKKSMNDGQRKVV